jgi:hypothetical protein
MKPLQRTMRYLGLCVSSILIPFLVVPTIILLTGSRESGMLLGLLTGLFLIQLAFSFFFLKSGILVNVVAATIVVILASLTTHLITALELRSGIDHYGFYDVITAYFFSATLFWESLYHILRKLSNPPYAGSS